MSGTRLLTGSMSEYMDLLLSWSVLMSIAPDITYGQEERAVQDWSCHSQAEILEKVDPAPLWGFTVVLILRIVM